MDRREYHFPVSTSKEKEKETEIKKNACYILVYLCITLSIGYLVSLALARLSNIYILSKQKQLP